MSLALLADSPCGDCGALLDEGQRYCVHCGHRRPDVEDPAVGWVARSRQAAAAPAGPPSPPARNPLALPALALALLPVAVGIGVLIGNHGGGGANQEQLLQALRNQKAPVVKVGNVAGGGAVAAAPSAGKAKLKGKAKTDKTGGKVVAKTAYGVAHQVSGYKPSTAKVQSDKKLVDQINKSIGKNYLQAQRNLPDTIVVSPGSGGGTTQAPTGRGD